MPTKTPRKRRGRPPGSAAPRADLIRQAALAIFASRGFGGASLRDIAAEAGVDVALISHNFGSKLGMWKAVIDSVTEKLVAAMLPAAPFDGPPLSAGARLHQVMAKFIDAVCDTPHLAQFAVKEVVQQDERFEYIYERLARPIHDFLSPLVKEAREAGEIGDVNSDFFFFAFAGAIAMTVAARPLIVRLSPAAESDAEFRRELKLALLGQLPSKIAYRRRAPAA